MQFPAAVVIALLPALGLAAPQNSNHNAGSAPGANRCNYSTFQTVLDSPKNSAKTDDCLQLAADLEKNPPRSWEVSGATRTYAHYGTCAFNAKLDNDNGNFITRGRHAFLGNGDITDLIDDTVRNHSSEHNLACHGSLAVRTAEAGSVSCDSAEKGEKPLVITWSIVKYEEKKN